MFPVAAVRGNGYQRNLNQVPFPGPGESPAQARPGNSRESMELETLVQQKKRDTVCQTRYAGH
jgi:hypothetical protein